MLFIANKHFVRKNVRTFLIGDVYKANVIASISELSFRLQVLQITMGFSPCLGFIELVRCSSDWKVIEVVVPWQTEDKVQ